MSRVPDGRHLHCSLSPVPPSLCGYAVTSCVVMSCMAAGSVLARGLQRAGTSIWLPQPLQNFMYMGSHSKTLEPAVFLSSALVSSVQQLDLLRPFWESRTKTYFDKMCAGKCLGPIEVSRSMSTDLSKTNI